MICKRSAYSVLGLRLRADCRRGPATSRRPQRRRSPVKGIGCPASIRFFKEFSKSWNRRESDDPSYSVVFVRGPDESAVGRPRSRREFWSLPRPRTPGTSASRLLPPRRRSWSPFPGITSTCSACRFNGKQVCHDRRTRPARRGPSSRRPPGRSGGRTSASGSGGPSARTTARAATPGTTSATTRPARAPTAGARTAWPASPTTSSASASRWRCGTARTPSSRSACSA